MKSKLLLVFILLASFSKLSAQQDAQWTNFMFDKLSFNPGYAGMSGSVCGGFFFREQWAGFGTGDDNPTSVLFNAHANLKDFNNSLPLGVGLTYVNDNLGAQTYNQLRFSVSYHLDLTDKNIGMFSFGASWGLVNTSITDEWKAPDGQSSIGQDVLIPVDGVSATNFSDFSVGVYYEYGRKAYGGVSMTHLSEQDISFDNTDIPFAMQSHLYLVGGYNYGFDNTDATGNSVLRSNVMIKTDLVENQYDMNLNYLWNQTLWAGVTYRVNDAVAPMIGYQTVFKNSERIDSKLKAGYSYGFITSDIRTQGNSSGSHEFFVTYCMSIKPKVVKQFHRNPRMMINR